MEPDGRYWALPAPLSESARPHSARVKTKLPTGELSDHCAIQGGTAPREDFGPAKSDTLPPSTGDREEFGKPPARS